MPIELNLIEEFDILTEFQFPDYIYSIDTIEEQIVFSKYINSLSNHRILLLHREIFDFPFVLAGLKEGQMETIIKDSAQELKDNLIFNFSETGFLDEITAFVDELDKRSGTTENSTRLKNILQYLKDNKYII